ncbi:MAG TPA: condensation domain-containing protein, partial [Longimicrobium sp.]|nr:condensation domain-containing protein [Longimicrobium sp.]
MRTLTTEERKQLLKLAQTASLEPAPPPLSPIERVERSGGLPLSFAQQRLWFLEQMGGLGSTYHIPGRLPLRGELDREALVRALNRLVERHEALRTTFALQGGEPEQRIGPETSGFQLVEHDLAGQAREALARVMDEEAAAPFDLERGPLIRGRLIRLAEDGHLLLFTMHHIVSDAWSIGVFIDELGRLYAAFREGRPDPLPPLPIQYADYAAWQRRWVEGEVLAAQASYWTKTLAGAPALLELPTDHPRPQLQEHAGASVSMILDEPLAAGLKALSRRHGTTLFMTCLAGWAVVLGRLSGQEEVVIGTPTANRGRREIEGLIGFFVNTLALRVDLSERPTVATVLKRVKARALEAQANQDIPFEQVVERVNPVRSLAYAPLFQVVFDWQNALRGSMELPGLEPGGAEPGGLPGAGRTTAKFDLTLALGEWGGSIGGSLTYATSLFERATVERHLAYLRRVLEAMAADDLQAVDALPLLPEAERRRVVEEWNATGAPYPSELCVHELFEAQAERTPDAEAVVHDGETLAYAELNARANRLAHHLRRRGVRPETRVGICLERGTELVVAILAVLKAGGAYVPLDPAYPAERLAFMLADSGAPLLLTRLPLPVGLTPHAAEVVCLDAERERIEAESAQAPAAGVLPGNLAYIIYTSGSTGRPKGVLVPHRGLANVARAHARDLGVGAGDRVLQFASPSFDASVAEMVMALTAGATLVLGTRETLAPGPDLLRLLHDEEVTV